MDNAPDGDEPDELVNFLPSHSDCEETNSCSLDDEYASEEKMTRRDHPVVVNEIGLVLYMSLHLEDYSSV